MAIFFFMVLPLTVWLYWPGATGPLLLDDYSSLVPVSLQTAFDSSWKEAVFGDRAGPLGRPLSMLTFAVEQRVFGIPLEEAKSTNVMLHVINGTLVFFLFRILLLATMPGAADWIALATAAFWLVAPIHISTVLYLVQRMAMLASFFVLLALFFYAWGRRMQLRGTAGWWFPCGLSPVMVAMGLFAKENAVIGFPAIFLIEFLVFRFAGFSLAVSTRARKICLGIICLGLCVAALLLTLNWQVLENSYALRPFSLHERVFTQWRVLWDYLGQIIFPDVARMGIHHDDFPLSTSPFHPASTLFAGIGWLLLALGTATLLLRRRGHLFSAGVLFFLLAHSLESSIIPLELYYEHRNYMPSVGIFLSLAALLAWLVRRVDGSSTPIGIAALVYFGFLVFSSSSQVRVWSSPSLLAINTVAAHAESPRANVDMAVHLARNGALVLARDYSHKAHALAIDERWLDYKFRDVILACYAGVVTPVPVLRSEIPSVEIHRPIADVHTLSVLVEMIAEGRCQGLEVTALADEIAAIFIEGAPFVTASALVYSRLAALENVLERYENAHWYAGRYLQLAPDNVTANLMLLHFSSILEYTEQTEVLRARLWELQQRGKLSASQGETLKLYGPAGSPNR